MAIRFYSLQTLASRGMIPSVVYAAQNPNRVSNPQWNFSRTVVVTFKSSGTWTCPVGVTSVEYLVVAGGGAGGQDAGAGGGAGGFRTGAGYAVTPGNTYTITVGAGGSSSSANGSDSVFDTITSTGGGGGGSYAVGTGTAGKGGGSVVAVAAVELLVAQVEQVILEHYHQQKEIMVAQDLEMVVEELVQVLAVVPVLQVDHQLKRMVVLVALAQPLQSLEHQ